MSLRPQSVNTHLLEVRLRPEFADAEGAGALGLLQGQGLASVREARVSRLYEIRGSLSVGQVLQAAKDLLCDGVTQEHRLVTPSSAKLNGGNAWRVEVWLKPAMADPVGETVREAIAEMGLPRPETVRCGLVYRLSGRCAKPQIERAVSRSLANPLIHHCVVAEGHS